MDEELKGPRSDVQGYSFESMSYPSNTNDENRVRSALVARERDHFSHYILRLAFCHQVLGGLSSSHV